MLLKSLTAHSYTPRWKTRTEALHDFVTVQLRGNEAKTQPNIVKP